MAYGTIRADSIQSDGGTAKTVNDLVASGGAIGAATATTASTSDDSTKVATTAFVKAQAYSTLASPTFTGTVTLPTGTVGTTQAASDNDTSIATTAYVKNQVGETAVVTAQRSMTERTCTASDFNLATGNLWTCGAIAIPNPTNGVAGQVGVLRVTAAPTSFGNQWDHPGGAYTAPASFPAIAPFFVTSSTQFLLGSWTEGVA
tara:strand:- start:1106 stop:1714 length:609 start_codon:yes stop_codon:yes gene_type:complete